MTVIVIGTTTDQLTDRIKVQIQSLLANEPLDEVEVIPISRDYADNLQQVCIDLRNERYFIAYENEKIVPISVLWQDMNFIRSNFGLDKLATGKGTTFSIVTKETLNYSRQLLFADYRKAIELGIDKRELENLQLDGTYGTYKGKDEQGLPIDIQREPQKLTKRQQVLYEIDMARGLFVVCKFVDNVSLS